LENKDIIKTIWFLHPWKVSSVPKESLKTFPALDGVALIHQPIKSLEYEWLEKYVKNIRDKLKNLYIYNNHIEMIDPRLMNLFAKMKRLKMWGNVCINEDFDISDGNTTYLNMKLMPCFQNYLADSISKVREKVDELQEVIKTGQYPQPPENNKVQDDPKVISRETCHTSDVIIKTLINQTHNVLIAQGIMFLVSVLVIGLVFYILLKIQYVKNRNVEGL
jgi:hypothetical protein